MGSGKTALFSSVVAAICIIIYITAIVFGAVQITLSINSRRVLAEQEFNDLAERASSAVDLGFMSDAYQLTMMDAIEESSTILGVILSGSNGQYGFERRQGAVISWVGDSPRFKPGFGLPSDPYHRNINISGQRNGSIQAQYSLIDYDALQAALKNTLTFVLGALALAIFALIIEIAMKNRTLYYARNAVPESEPDHTQAAGHYREAVYAPHESAPEPEPVQKSFTPPRPNKPQGLFSPRSNVGWESYTQERLASELHRCAAGEQDLVFISMEYGGEDAPLSDDTLYRQLAGEAQKFFANKDLIFEKGEYGFSVIVPGIGLEQGIAKSEEFIKRAEAGHPGIFDTLCVGLSSRSGRLVEAERLMFESSKALQKAKEDTASRIIGFKSDPEKYREFISRR